MGLTFTQPTSVTSTSPQFAGCFGVSATLCVVSDGKLFDPDPFDSPIEVPSGHAYLGLGVKVNVAPGVDINAGKLAFGFTVGSTVCMSHYQSFATTATTPTFQAALLASLQNYVIPFGPDDFAALGIGDVAVIGGDGLASGFRNGQFIDLGKSSRERLFGNPANYASDPGRRPG